MNRLLAISIVNLFLFSSAFGQVKLPPEEIGFISPRIIEELSRWARSDAWKAIDLAYVQKQLEQDAESKCTDIENLKDHNTKGVLEGRLSRARASMNQSLKISHLICGIEEFVLYDASQHNLIARRTLNRARQMVLNIGKLEGGNIPSLADVKVQILLKAYSIGLANYDASPDATRGDFNFFQYALNGREFVSMIGQLLPSITNESVKVVALENTLVWLASDYAADEIFGNYANEALNILASVSTKRELAPLERARHLSDQLKSSIGYRPQAKNPFQADQSPRINASAGASLL